MRKRKRTKTRAAKPPTVCARCQRPFHQSRSTAKYCSGSCRTKAHHARAGHKPLRCHHCGGKHLGSDCQTKTNGITKLYGTVVDGRYVPPPGVNVRIMQIDSMTHGDTLTRILRELDS
jgi:hypothetical protein